MADPMHEANQAQVAADLLESARHALRLIQSIDRVMGVDEDGTLITEQLEVAISAAERGLPANELEQLHQEIRRNVVMESDSLRQKLAALLAVVEAAKAVNWNAVYYALGDDDFCKFGLDDLRVAVDALIEASIAARQSKGPPHAH